MNVDIHLSDTVWGTRRDRNPYPRRGSCVRRNRPHDRTSPRSDGRHRVSVRLPAVRVWNTHTPSYCQTPGVHRSRHAANMTRREICWHLLSSVISPGVKTYRECSQMCTIDKDLQAFKQSSVILSKGFLPTSSILKLAITPLYSKVYGY